MAQDEELLKQTETLKEEITTLLSEAEQYKRDLIALSIEAKNDRVTLNNLLKETETTNKELEEIRDIKNVLENLILETREKKKELQSLYDETKTAKRDLDIMLGYAGALIRYGAVCYTQVRVNTSQPFDGEYVIRYPYEELPNNGLLFVVPQYSSIPIDETKRNRLTIRFQQVQRDGTVAYTGKKTYDIIKETSNGVHNLASSGDIVANRLAIFRFITGDKNSIILVNNPQYNEVQISTLHVTNNASFHRIPTVIKDEGTPVQLSTVDELLKLEDRVLKLENKFIYGVADAKDVLYDKPEGTIYIKIEENEYD